MLDNLEIMLNRYSFIRHSLFDVDTYWEGLVRASFVPQMRSGPLQH